MNFAIKSYNKLFYEPVGTGNYHCSLDDASADILISDVDLHSKI
jgi:hypothetical protein